MRVTLLLVIPTLVVLRMSSAVTIIILVPMIYAIPILDVTTLLFVAMIITHVLKISVITPLDAITLLSIAHAINVTQLPVLTMLVASQLKLTAVITIIVPQNLVIPTPVVPTPL